ncbi:hypothetical protein HMPREF1869_01010 [Bacteroidales bacterium KA00251]|nr:hypothetical protein HMPREF1869_01010 [Bacteroidales bacterium KA00251]
MLLEFSHKWQRLLFKANKCTSGKMPFHLGERYKTWLVKERKSPVKGAEIIE